MATVSPTDDEVATVLRAFLLSILPTGVEVIQGQLNRVAEPVSDDFVVFWPIRRPRLATNSDDYADAVFTGSIASLVLTITSVLRGVMRNGATVFGNGVAAGTRVTSFGTGTGGVGTYNINPTQTVASRTLSAGVQTIMQETEIVMQLDVHGPTSADNAQTISTLFRDAYAVEFFASLSSSVSPLYADSPKQLPFLNGEEQQENRWIIEAVMQADEVITVPQQFADVVEVDLVNVEATYPA